jgi:hypothetical protein
MSFVTVFMAVTTAFVLLAPIAMAVVLVTGSGTARRMAPVPVTVDGGCRCVGACSCATEHELPRAA